jgi:hypothetical protein
MSMEQLSVLVRGSVEPTYAGGSGATDADRDVSAARHR